MAEFKEFQLGTFGRQLSLKIVFDALAQPTVSLKKNILTL